MIRMCTNHTERTRLRLQLLYTCHNTEKPSKRQKGYVKEAFHVLSFQTYTYVSLGVHIRYVRACIHTIRDILLL